MSVMLFHRFAVLQRALTCGPVVAEGHLRPATIHDAAAHRMGFLPHHLREVEHDGLAHGHVGCAPVRVEVLDLVVPHASSLSGCCKVVATEALGDVLAVVSGWGVSTVDQQVALHYAGKGEWYPLMSCANWHLEADW